jgi:hypothetical protein
VRYATAGGGGCLSGADIEPAVELEGIAIDDFTGKDVRDTQGQLALSRCRRADDHYQRPLHFKEFHVLPS